MTLSTQVRTTDTARVHGAPSAGSGVTTCCRRTPVVLPRTDRITVDPALVTCQP
ncbi:hypothetical protein ACQPXT_13655 [Streptomyces sp. CA-100214]